MAKPIKYRRVVGKNAENFPAILLKFKGKEQSVYFALREMGEAMSLSQTAFARKILSDYVLKNYKGKISNFVEIQQNLRLEPVSMRIGKKRKNPE